MDAKAVMYADFFDEPVLQKNITPKRLLSKKENRTGLEYSFVDKDFEEKEDKIGDEDSITKIVHDVMEYDDGGGGGDDDYDDDTDDDGGVDDDGVDDDDDYSVDDDDDDKDNDDDNEHEIGIGNDDALSDQDNLPDNAEMKPSLKSTFERESLKVGLFFSSLSSLTYSY